MIGISGINVRYLLFFTLKTRILAMVRHFDEPWKPVFIGMARLGVCQGALHAPPPLTLGCSGISP
jgi:hypothetical protein